MQVLHRSNQACECLSEINSLVISDVIIENGNYLLQEYFCQTDKTRKCFVILSASRKRSLDRVDLRFGKDMELPRLATSLQSTPSFCAGAQKRRGISGAEVQEYFCQTDKTRKCFVILSASRKRSLDRVDLRFGKDMELPRLATSLQSTPSFPVPAQRGRGKRRGISGAGGVCGAKFCAGAIQMLGNLILFYDFSKLGQCCVCQM